MISCQLLEKSTVPECVGSYLGFPMFFFLLKNNKAGSHFWGSGGHGSSLLLPTSFCCFAQKELRGSQAFSLKRSSFQMSLHLKVLGKKIQGSCLSSTSQWQLSGNETLMTPFLSALPTLVSDGIRRKEGSAGSPVYHPSFMPPTVLAAAKEVVRFLPLRWLGHL